MNSEINYIKLFFALFLAIVLGNLTVSGIKTWVVVSGMTIAMEDFSQTTNEQLQESKIRSEMVRQENQKNSESSRKKTQVGKSLARQCNEWTYANNANRNQYASEQKAKFCNAYSRYIKNGSTPNFKF